jgi:hypothetical protein
LHENWVSTIMSRRVQVHLLSEVREDRSDRATHSIQNLFKNRLTRPPTKGVLRVTIKPEREAVSETFCYGA